MVSFVLIIRATLLSNDCHSSSFCTRLNILRNDIERRPDRMLSQGFEYFDVGEPGE
jgi:hypothetical protein